jgi:hypothetical protein
VLITDRSNLFSTSNRDLAILLNEVLHYVYTSLQMVAVMTYAVDNSVDFLSVARELAAKTQPQINPGNGLVPAEASARMLREGNGFLRKPQFLGATVDQEGLTNNYAVEPGMYLASFPSPEQVRQYVLQGGAAALLVVSLVLTAIAVS